MPNVYNLSQVYAANDTVQIIQALNDVSGGWLGLGFVFVYFLILIISMKFFEAKVAIASAASITLVVATPLSILGLISEWAMGAIVILAGLSAAILYFTR